MKQAAAYLLVFGLLAFTSFVNLPYGVSLLSQPHPAVLIIYMGYLLLRSHAGVNSMWISRFPNQGSALRRLLLQDFWYNLAYAAIVAAFGAVSWLLSHDPAAGRLDVLRFCLLTWANITVLSVFFDTLLLLRGRTAAVVASVAAVGLSALAVFALMYGMTLPNPVIFIMPFSGELPTWFEILPAACGYALSAGLLLLLLWRVHGKKDLAL